MTGTPEQTATDEQYDPARDYDSQTHDVTKCNIGPGPCPGCNAYENG